MMPIDFTKLRLRVETTYADLRPTDLVIDKAGNSWPIDDLQNGGDVKVFGVTFWLCEPATKVRLHYIIKTGQDTVTVSRVPTQADEAAKLEAEFPGYRFQLSNGERYSMIETPKGLVPIILDGPDSMREILTRVAASMEEAVAAVEAEMPAVPWTQTPEVQAIVAEKWNAVKDRPFDEELFRGEPKETTVEEVAEMVQGFLGGEVEAEVTAEEVDAAHAATDDAPVRLPAFVSMTPLEQRSHLYLLHGVYAADLKGRDELDQMHFDAHRQHAEGKLNSRHIPHAHEGVSS